MVIKNLCKLSLCSLILLCLFSFELRSNGLLSFDLDNPSEVAQRQNKKKNKTQKNSKENTKQVSVGEDDVVLTVTGDGTTKEAATLSALRSALEQVYGTLVSGNTQILNDEIVKDEIVSVSSGFVKGYTYLSEERASNDKYYVVIKAVVTPKNLVSYVKQKVGGDIEIAGASFATNVRLEKLNAQNKFIVNENITKMQQEILPQCFDYVIRNVRGPSGGYNHQTRKEEYSIYFDVDVKVNDNIKIIGSLEEQRPEGSSVFNNPQLISILPSLCLKFKIVDDLGEYWFEKDNNASNRSNEAFIKSTNSGRQGNVGLRLQSSSNNNRISLFYHNIRNWLYVTDKFYTRDGYLKLGPGTREDLGFNDAEMSAFKSEHDAIYSLEQRGVEIEGQGRLVLKNLYARKDYPVMRIRMRATYTLDELDKVSGIRIILR